MKPLQAKVKIIGNARLKEKYHKLVFASPALARIARPGQFMMLKVADEEGPLLRRPLGIHRVSGARIELLYEVVGEGTQLLARRRPGRYLDIIGPLGNGFDLGAGNSAAVVVAGGIGVAPLVFLAQKLRKHKGLALIGARTAAGVLCEKEFKNSGFSVTIATDDGSRGFHGRVTDLLEKELRTTHYKLRTIYACGPEPMIRQIARISRKYNVPAQVSLEAHMACGIGACLGCVVKTKHGYKRVCKEGPVFGIEELAE